MEESNETQIPVGGRWRDDLERRMREVASNPESHFPEKCRTVMDLVEQRHGAIWNIESVSPGLESIEARLDHPESCDRVIALTFFFQVAAFIRALTPRMLARVSDEEIKFLALCLGLDF